MCTFHRESLDWKDGRKNTGTYICIPLRHIPCKREPDMCNVLYNNGLTRRFIEKVMRCARTDNIEMTADMIASLDHEAGQC